MTRELKVHNGPKETAQEEFNREHILAISGLVRPSLARAAADETSDPWLFGRPKPMLEARGQVSTLRGLAEDSALGIILGRVARAGQCLGLNMFPRLDSKPGAQAIEMSPKSDAYHYRLGRHGVAAFMALEGGFALDSGSTATSKRIVPGTVVFLKDQAAPHSIETFADDTPSTGLLVAGQEVRRAPTPTAR